MHSLSLLGLDVERAWKLSGWHLTDQLLLHTCDLGDKKKHCRCHVDRRTLGPRGRERQLEGNGPRVARVSPKPSSSAPSPVLLRSTSFDRYARRHCSPRRCCPGSRRPLHHPPCGVLMVDRWRGSYRLTSNSLSSSTRACPASPRLVLSYLPLPTHCPDLTDHSSGFSYIFRL